MANPSELKRGDIVEYVGNYTPGMKGAVGVVKANYGPQVGVEVVWISLPSKAYGAMEDGWVAENLRALHPQENKAL